MPRGYHQAFYYCHGHCYYNCNVYVQAFVLIHLLRIANMITNKVRDVFMNTSIMISSQEAAASQVQIISGVNVHPLNESFGILSVTNATQKANRQNVKPYLWQFCKTVLIGRRLLHVVNHAKQC